MLSDPIAALATPPGRSAIAVVRVSGDGALAVAARVVRGFRSEPPRVARLASFLDGEGTVIDRGLYLVFPAPRSETGEDLVELQCHGGHLVPMRVLAALETAGARQAHPGEFTRRAVLNGKLDLLQAEALGDLIDAEAPAQGRAALLQLEGGLSRRIAALRGALVELLALLAYAVDFPEEDDGPIPLSRLELSRAGVATQIDQLLVSAPRAERIRRGALVVLTGPPNAGKSSLFNALLGSERALVTDLAGTTRDAIESPADFLGWPIRLVDTAGLGTTEDRIEVLGQAMSRRYLDAADLVLRCTEATDRSAESRGSDDARTIEVRTKADLVPTADTGLAVSVVSGAGIGELRRRVADRLFASGSTLGDLAPALTRERHRVALVRAAEALDGARPHLALHGDAVLAAHHVQEAVYALDALVGAIDIEEVLDRLFASFCVGK